MSKPSRTKLSPATCQICGQEKALSELLPGELVRPSLVETIRREFPQWSSEGHICLADLSKYRREYLRSQLADELGELSALDQEVFESLQQRELLSTNPSAELDRKLTVGERIADRIASFGGSWTFILTFLGGLITWIVINVTFLASHPFDPYPFILLNLLLSCLAAFQGPVIMMSQNRVESRDRLGAENDYKVNLKAELEIRHLHEKMDHLLRRQWNRLFEIQQIQIELLEEINARKDQSTGSR